MLNINFFKPQGPFNLEDLTENVTKNGGIKIFDIKTLENASNKESIFFCLAYLPANPKIMSLLLIFCFFLKFNRNLLDG